MTAAFSERAPLRFLAAPEDQPHMTEVMPVITLLPRNGYALSLWRGQLSLPGRWTMAEIVDLVASAYSVSVADLKGPGRTQYIVRPRQHAMWLMAQQGHLSLSMIGGFLGRRDHTTVLHGANQHQARLAAECAGRAAA